ncbi:MAG: hypothetical protein L6437_06335, partial [Kiritimatiellae bacterium]|nr:hypothetical protein [Kiritimatiellia bacterium]
MTHKERVQCSLRWQDPDRVPVRIYATPEIAKQLENYFGGDYAKALDVDLWPVSATYQGKVRPAQGDIAFDIWGIGYRQVQHSKTGTYSEAVCLPWANITTMDDVEKYPWPNPCDFDFSTIEAQCDQLKEYSITYGSASVPDIVNGVSRGRGMEQVLMDIALRDEVGLAIIDKRVDFCFEHAKRALEAGKGKIDILCLGEDCGNQNGRMVSPKDFGDVFYSRLKKF